MSAPLNANAKEWRPTGDLASLQLTALTSSVNDRAALADGPGPGVLADGDNTPPPSLSAQVEEFRPQQPPNIAAAATNGGGLVDLGDVNWTEEFERVMALTRELIERQMSGEAESARRADTNSTSHANETHNTGAERPPSEASSRAAAFTDASRFPALPGSDEVRPLVSGKWVNAPSVLLQKTATNGKGEAHAKTTPTAAAPSSAAVPEFDENGRPLPPLTSKGNRRWKRPTKAQQKRELAQKNAFEAFANALLHSVSPFMAPLRERCKTSLPHIKVDQRFGKSGQPQTAVAQFVVAPLVTNYRPRHFHDLTPGDLMEFHYDFAQVLKQFKSASDIHFGYGPVWKRYAVPYCYVNCKEYRQEVLSLCPDEVPNMRVEAVYEDDIVKDITEVVLAVEELEPLQNISIIQAMSRRVNLAPLFDAFDTIFQPIENYRIIIRDLHRAPSTFLIHASHNELAQKPSPLVLYNDPNLWYELPVVSRIRVEESTVAVDSQHHAVGPSLSSRPGRREQDRPAPAAPGDCAVTGQRRRGEEKARPRETTPALAAVAPVVGSALCLVVTAGIVWWRRSRR